MPRPARVSCPAGPQRIRLFSDPFPSGGPTLPVLLAVPIVRARSGESGGGDFCPPELLAPAAGAHAREVYGAPLDGGCHLPRLVVPAAHGCLRDGGR